MAFEGLSEKLSAAFKRLKNKGKLTESDVKSAMREVRMALLEADVNYKVAKDFTAKVTERAVGSDVMESLTPAQMVIKIVNEELTSLMGSEETRINFAGKPPTIIMMCGLQGSGKTTHSAKLAKMYKKQGHRPLLAAYDVYRPAAIEQLADFIFIPVPLQGEHAGDVFPGEGSKAGLRIIYLHAGGNGKHKSRDGVAGPALEGHLAGEAAGTGDQSVAMVGKGLRHPQHVVREMLSVGVHCDHALRLGTVLIHILKSRL